MIKNCITLTLLVFVTSLYAQTTYVPDDEFEYWLETHYWRNNYKDNGTCELGDNRAYGDGIENNNLVRTDKVEQSERLHLRIPISNFTGIESFINLEWLYYEHVDNDFNIPVEFNFQNNRELQILDIRETNISSINLSNNNQLLEFRLDDVILENLDLSTNINLGKLYFRNLPKLSEIDLSHNVNLSNTQIFECPLIKNLNLSASQNLGFLAVQWMGNLCALNIKNSNNTNLSQYINHNPLLSCITVDDAAWSNSNWNNVDGYTFSEDPCVESPIINFSNNDVNAGNDNLTQPFISEIVNINGEDYYKASTKAKNYFYYYIETTCEMPNINEEVVYNFSEGAYNFPVNIKYIGNKVLQCYMDLTSVTNEGQFTFSYPESLDFNGRTYLFSNRPVPFNVNLDSSAQSQTIDIFAGASLGASVILGGIGAGPSIAAAKISASGSAGMGMTFERDAAGNQKISRRFEYGSALKVNIPSINIVVGDVLVGAQAEAIPKRVLGQSMVFPNSLNTELSKKAKAAYLLETFAIGGVPFSPFTGMFLSALQKSLVITNPDLDGIYSSLKQYSLSGETLEGSWSAGFSYEYGDNIKLVMSELGQNVTMSRSRTNNLITGDDTFKVEYAKAHNGSLLNLKLFDVNVANDYAGTTGTSSSFEATKTGTGKDTFKLSFETFETDQEIDVFTYFKSKTQSFIVPEEVIQNNYDKPNIMGSAMATLNNRRGILPFEIGLFSFAEDLKHMYKVGSDKLVNIQDHTLIEIVNESSIGAQPKFSFDLDAALGIGLGLKAEFKVSYLDEMEYLKDVKIVAESKLLPLVEHNTLLDTDRIFTFQDEIDDIFEGLPLLIQGSLNELVLVANQLIEDGVDFFVEIGNATATISGVLGNGAKKWILRKLNPTYYTIFNKGADFKSEVRKIYASKTLVSKNITSKSSRKLLGVSTLYIVSDNINVNLLDINDIPIETFDPVTLSIVIDQEKIDELEFTNTEKALAKMYRYNDDNFIWEEVSGDTDTDINIVATQITKSANYAIGIAYDTANDTKAPDIIDQYPKQGNTILPVIDFWAELYEPVTGVGLDLSQTFIKIDGIEVEALWNPVDDKISYKPITPLTAGDHTFEVVVKDLNGNTNSIFSTFTVSYDLLSPGIKMFLEGPYDTNTGLMKDDLRSNGLVPTTTPYADAIMADVSVFNTGGTSTTGLPKDDIIDWVWLELRDKTDGTTVVESRSALLQRDGDVVDVDGLSSIIINIAYDDYYVVVSHRNHLGIQTAATVNASGGLIDLDFLNNSTLAEGNTNAIKAMSNGKYAIFAGDFNGDGQVQNTDKSALEPLRGISGYNNADIDMNGEVQNTDINTLLNPNIGKGVQFMSKRLNAKRKQ